MIGLMGLALLVAALALLLSAIVLAQSVHHIPVWQKGASLVLYVVGILLLLVVAFAGSHLAFVWSWRIEVHGLSAAVAAPTILDWAEVGLFSLVSALLVALGLRCGTKWRWSRCALWGTAVLCVWPAAVLIFWSLYPILPISA